MDSLKSSAPGQYLGFSIQPLRMCVNLFKCDENSTIALEFLDDVAEITSDGSVIVEQTKSGLSHNPVSNWSTDLWKTFSNWLKAATSGHLDVEKTIFRIYVAQNYTGGFVTKLSIAKTQSEIDSILEEIYEQFELDNPKGCSEFLKYFFNYDPLVRSTIIRNFTYECGGGDLYYELKGVMNPFVSPLLVENACQAAIGWIKMKTDELINDGIPAIIHASEFRLFFRSYLKKHDRDAILASFSTRPTETEIDLALGRFPVFIKQLDLIDCESDEKIRAMSDYLRAVSEKTQWSARGLIFQDGFNELEESLIENWRIEKARVVITEQERSDVEKGKLIYLGNVQKTHRMEDKDLPPFFSKGTLHSLADKLKLGWHPHFKIRLESNND